MEKKTVVTLASLAFVAAVAWFYIATPKTYEECIEQNIGKAATRESSLIVDQMCKKKFPKVYSENEVFGR